MGPESPLSRGLGIGVWIDIEDRLSVLLSSCVWGMQTTLGPVSRSVVQYVRDSEKK